MVRDYLGIGGRVRREPLRDAEALRAFLSSRASFIAQTSLYGYMRTRAGQRYPELFENDGFVELLNAAKWHMWLACLSDVTVYAGGLLARGGMPEERVGMLMRRLLDATLAAFMQQGVGIVLSSRDAASRTRRAPTAPRGAWWSWSRSPWSCRGSAATW